MERSISRNGKQNISFKVPANVTGVTPLIYANFEKKESTVPFEINDVKISISNGI